MDTLTNDEVLAAGLDDWRKLAQALHARFRTPDYATGAAFVAGVAELAERAQHHPDITLRHGVVDLELCTREAGRWLTRKDLDLAARVSTLAREHGLTAEPTAVTQVEWALDTADRPAIAGFWAALLTGDVDNVLVNDVIDPTARVPNLWFQDTDPHEPPRQRWHADVWVAPEEATARIDAAVAAGGTVVDDSQAPSFVVLADADGNQACVCTCLDRT